MGTNRNTPNVWTQKQAQDNGDDRQRRLYQRQECGQLHCGALVTFHDLT
jgi:hypothetical protein